MIPTVQFIQEKFAEFNLKMFGGRLPDVAVSLCHVTSFVGQYKSLSRVHADGRRENYSHQLRFSTAFDLEERVLEDTVIHEMIHYFISYNGLQDRTAHGPLFKAIMHSINENYGRSINISHRASNLELEKARTSSKKWHVIAILHFTTGEKGVKVLPRVIPRIMEYHRTLSNASNIRRIDLYLHNSPFFNRYPTSTGRRCHAISEAEISEHLAGAYRLSVKGGKLIQH